MLDEKVPEEVPAQAERPSAAPTEPVAAAEETAYDEVKSLEAPQNPSGGRQTLLIAGGVAICGIVGVAAAGIGPFRRKK